jgi:hypothetical protein
MSGEIYGNVDLKIENFCTIRLRSRSHQRSLEVGSLLGLLLLVLVLLFKQDLKRLQTVLEQQRHCFVLVHERVVHEAVEPVLHQLPKIDREAPRVRSVRLEPFKENALDLLLDDGIGSHEQRVQQQTRAVSMCVRVAQLIDDRFEQHNPRGLIKFLSYLLEQFVVAVIFIFRASVLQVLLSDIQNNSVDYERTWHCFAANRFALFHHFGANFLDDGCLFCFEVSV